MELKKISEEELKEKLEFHRKWLIGEEEGVKLDLRNVDLSYTDLRNVDLSYADLSYANLKSANLYEVNLRYTDLSYANLKSANLYEVNLRYTDLSYANLRYANLSNANLSNANLINVDLSYANLSYANLSNANLSNANLESTNLRHADLKNANLKYANLSCADLKCAVLSYADLNNVDLTNAKLNNIKYNHLTSFLALQCPEKGSFIAYKKAKDINSDTEVIVELLVMEDSLRSSATSRKCRFSHTKTLSITSLDGTVEYNISCSMRDKNFIYAVGKENIIENFDKNRWSECSTGIHGFITREEAVKY